MLSRVKIVEDAGSRLRVDTDENEGFRIRQNDVKRPNLRFKNIRIRMDEALSFRFKIIFLS